MQDIAILVAIVVDELEHKSSECDISHTNIVSKQVSGVISTELLFQILELLRKDFHYEICKIEVFVYKVRIVFSCELIAELLQVLNVIYDFIDMV